MSSCRVTGPRIVTGDGTFRVFAGLGRQDLALQGPLGLRESEPAPDLVPHRHCPTALTKAFSLATFPPGGRYQGQERPIGP
jgi:hypothetical protein